jgi:hypothetical protein
MLFGAGKAQMQDNSLHLLLKIANAKFALSLLTKQLNLSISLW